MSPTARYEAALAAVLAATLTHSASAHGIAGKRVFPVTLNIDDPAVADEASFPTVVHQRHGATDSDPAIHETDITGEYDKRITRNLGVAINYGYTILDRDGQKGSYGFQNLSTTLKYQFFENDDHELLVSAGVIRQWGATGAARVNASPTGATTPTLYFGKGFGDLPDGLSWLKPLAFTGTFGYQIQDVPRKSTTVFDPDSGIASLQLTHNPDLLIWGGSIQYSLPYLQANVKDHGLPDFVNRLIPLVEVAYTNPATSSNGTPTSGIVAPGVIYLGDSFQLGIEAIIPATKGSNASTGFVAQLHFFLDDIFPKSLGRPLLGD